MLVATFCADHEHHRSSIDVFLRFGKNDACCAAHSLAEVYATLTSMPAPRRVSGDQALLFLGDIRGKLTIVALDAREARQASREADRQPSKDTGLRKPGSTMSWQPQHHSDRRAWTGSTTAALLAGR